jgi:hypothetical protein
MGFNMKRFLIFSITFFSFFNCTNINKELDRDFQLSLLYLLKRLGEAEISGVAFKGPISGGRVQVFELTDETLKNGCTPSILNTSTPLAEATTSGTGEYTIRYKKSGKPACVLITPASNGLTLMYDETLRRNISWTNSANYLSTIVKEPGGPTQKGVISSPFSRMSARIFAKTMEKASPRFANEIANSTSRQIVAMFGLNKGFNRTKSGRARDKILNIRKKKNLSRNSRTEREEIPSLEDLEINFNRPDDSLTSKFYLVSSGLSAIAQKYAVNSGKAKSLGKNAATEQALEELMDGFAEVAASGGKESNKLNNVCKTANGGNPIKNFVKNPLESATQWGITSYVKEAGGADEFDIDLEDWDSYLSEYFDMDSVPPSWLWFDFESPPDYISYDTLYFYNNQFEYYYPWFEGGVPETYTLTSGTLPAGLFLDSTTGEIYGSPTESGDFSVTISASNEYSSEPVTTTFTIRVLADENVAIAYPEQDDICYAGNFCTFYFYVEGPDEYTITSVEGLPEGFEVDPNDPSIIYGTPVSGSYDPFTVTVSLDSPPSDFIGETLIYIYPDESSEPPP